MEEALHVALCDASIELEAACARVGVWAVSRTPD